MHVSGIDFGNGWNSWEGKGKGKEGRGKGNGAFGKGYGKNGKGNGKGKKGKSKGFGKSAGKGKDYTDSSYFIGDCGRCGNWGHRRKDCRKRASYIDGKKKESSASGDCFGRRQDGG